MAQYKVQDYPDLRKDERGFVVNANQTEYQNALKRQKKLKDDEMLYKRVAGLEENMNEILSLLRSLNKQDPKS